MARVLDLNADVGEGVDGDRELLEVVTSASVACGFHAGDDSTMRDLCTEAVERQVAIGAHVGYRDREGFGRRDLSIAPATVEAETAEQISTLKSHAAAAGGRVAYVKPHGALYHRASVDSECAAAILSAMDAGLALLAPPGSVLLAQGREAGRVAVAEGFADRGYASDGSLVPRGSPGAVLEAGHAVRQALSLARGGVVGSLCVHGDTPGALELARRVAAELKAIGVELRAFA
jgi:5-oxoprolinase (ATP-hydrolysing) subunit A